MAEGICFGPFNQDQHVIGGFNVRDKGDIPKAKVSFWVKDIAGKFA